MLKFSKSIFIACVLMAGCTRPVVSQKNVVYGEKEKRSFPDDKPIRVFFDREGLIYPDFFIPDEELLRAGASLRNWYKDHEAAFRQIAMQNRLNLSDANDSSINLLQDQIIRQYATRIKDAAAGSDDISILVHGFRKAFKEQDNKDYTSVRDYDSLRRSILSYGKKKHLFVEIYWDAMYDRFEVKNIRNNKAILKMFEKEATIHAVHTGYELRKLLVRLDSKPLKIISHSLGARVVTTALFNTDSTEQRFFTDSSYRTPENKSITFCLIAPAIGGSEVFSCYYHRNTNGDYRSKDNYRLLVVYNEKDFVLLKKDPKFLVIGPGPRKYGVTTLGSNYSGEVALVAELFRCNYPGSEFKTLDFTPMGEHHHLRNYVAYPLFSELVSFLEEEAK